MGAKRDDSMLDKDGFLDQFLQPAETETGRSCAQSFVLALDSLTICAGKGQLSYPTRVTFLFPMLSCLPNPAYRTPKPIKTTSSTKSKSVEERYVHREPTESESLERIYHARKFRNDVHLTVGNELHPKQQTKGCIEERKGKVDRVRFPDVLPHCKDTKKGTVGMGESCRWCKRLPRYEEENYAVKQEPELRHINVRLEQLEEEKKRNNIVIAGINVEEINGNNLKQEMVSFLLQDLKVESHIKTTHEIGQKLCTLRDGKHARQVKNYEKQNEPKN
ncbi:hypothetical protein FQA39_LY03608 [Lamprigera yunnana]|nr:hypothetical protein FQA39_LY03608 [Lamprigera yunnana]